MDIREARVAEDRAASDGADLLTLQEAADALKVHYMTAYRWVRRGELPAFKAGGRLRVRTGDLQDFLRSREVDTARPAGEERRTDWPLHVDRLHTSLRDGAAADAGALVRRVIADGAPVGDVYLQLVTPALHRVGADWAAERITVAEEHRATAIAWTIVARLGEHFRRRGPARGTVVTVTPPEEAHALASVMVADFLRAGGYDVHHLGADVPIGDLRRFLGDVCPDAVCISVTRTDHEEGALAELVELTRSSDGTMAVVGGQGVDADAAERLGAVHVSDLAALTDRLAAGDPP